MHIAIRRALIIVIGFESHFSNIGLLTIGPRFGGAIDDAARYFKDACDKVSVYS